MYYLASPYWHPKPTVRSWRHKSVTQVAAYLIYKRKVCIYSPLTHNVPLAELIEDRYNIKSGMGEELGHEFWVHVMDLPILRKCDRLIVLQLPGWEESRGVSEEILAAKTIKIPIEYLKPVLDEDNYVIGLITQ